MSIAAMPLFLLVDRAIANSTTGFDFSRPGLHALWLASSDRGRGA
jgi:hypothetical protein